MTSPTTGQQVITNVDGTELVSLQNAGSVVAAAAINTILCSNSVSNQRYRPTNSP